MTDAVEPLPLTDAPSFGLRVQRARREGFVGRDRELALFRRALGGEPGTPRVLLVHGPGGVGKSALLRRLADEAGERTVVQVDGHQVLASSTAFEQAVEPVRESGRALLLVDGFEHCQVLERWLREELLLRLPEQTVVVVASRQRPDPQWTVDAGWRELVRVVPLGDLEPDAAQDLLADRGVPLGARPALTHFAGGHPLALTLAAEALDGAPTPDAVDWSPTRDVTDTLLKQLVDQAPTAATELALRVCGHARHTTVELLRAGLDEEAAVAAFAWLRERPYVEAGPHGLAPHDLVRDLLDADFAWRDPARYVELHDLLWRHLSARVEAASGESLRTAVNELIYLCRYAEGATAELYAGGRDQLFEREYDPSLRADVLALATREEGPAHARLVEYWLDRQPEGFHVYFGSDDLAPVSFIGQLRIARPSAAERAADPAMAAVAAHIDATAGPDGGEHVSLTRFLVPRPAHDRCTVGADLHTVRISVDNVEHGRGRTASYLLLPDHSTFTTALGRSDFRLCGPVDALGPDDWGLFVHDWREVPLSTHLRRCLPAIGCPEESSDDAPPPPAALARDQHDEAVKQALRDWHDETALAANPLARGGDAAVVRTMLQEACAAVATDPRHVKLHRAVTTTFIDRETTQEAAASRLGVPFSTFRRHLRRGVAEVCENAWTQRPLSQVE